MKKMNEIIHNLARTLALIGGVILIIISTTTVISVLSRYFFNAPLSGDIEIVEIGILIAIACFMPLCQWRNGHVTVHIFTDHLPQKIKNILAKSALIIMVLSVSLIAYRLSHGAYDMAQYGDETMFLSIRLWWPAALLALAMAFFAAIALIMLLSKER